MVALGLLIPAFVSGIFMFFAPCTLPLVPAYLAFISGVSPKDSLEDQKNKIRKNSIFFVLGFSLVFVVLGLLLGLLGSSVAGFRDGLLRVGGALIILFGLLMLKVFSFSFLSSQKSVRLPSWIRLGTPTSSLIVGSVFALGWSPCIGPVLGTVLVLAGTLGTAVSGGILLASFSLGFAIPFLVLAFLYQELHGKIQRYDTVFKWFSIIGGVIFIGMGILLVSNQWNLLSEWGFKLLHFINYDAILQYL